MSDLSPTDWYAEVHHKCRIDQAEVDQLVASLESAMELINKWSSARYCEEAVHHYLTVSAAQCESDGIDNRLATFLATVAQVYQTSAMVFDTTGMTQALWEEREQLIQEGAPVEWAAAWLPPERERRRSL